MRTGQGNETTLIVAGSLLSSAELKDDLNVAGADVVVTRSVSEAFRLLATRKLDGAIIDHGLHNEAFDFCMELRERSVPYIFASTPHKLQTEAARRADARHATGRLARMMSAAEPELGAIMTASHMHPDPGGRVSHS